MSKPFIQKAGAFLLMLFSLALGGGSLLVFLYFLYTNGFQCFPLGLSPPAALGLDAALSLLFFIQHSGMIRGPGKRWLDRHFPAVYQGAVYSIVSGALLFLVMGLWQPVPLVLYAAAGAAEVLIRIVFFLPILGFIWCGLTLDSLDSLGTKTLWHRLFHKPEIRPHLVIRGPYQWVRHPMYAGVFVFIWATPVLTLDRLLFNLLWSAWLYVGVRMEESGLVSAYGDAYRRYQQFVPMLLPVRLNPGKKLKEQDF
ncbi:MAG: methyltransferase family protein [Thermodesulfobacteriota bacterium]